MIEDFNWRAFVHFGGDSGNDRLRQQMEDAIQQIYETQDGRAILLEAMNRAKAAYEANGLPVPDQPLVINLVDNPLLLQAGAAAFGNGLQISATNSLQYSDIDGNRVDASLQRVLFHELYHVAKGHADLNEQEKQTVDATNNFMQKHFGEAHRDFDVPSNSSRRNGWEWNPNFNEDGYQANFMGQQNEQQFAQNQTNFWDAVRDIFSSLGDAGVKQVEDNQMAGASQAGLPAVTSGHENGRA